MFLIPHKNGHRKAPESAFTDTLPRVHIFPYAALIMLMGSGCASSDRALHSADPVRAYTAWRRAVRDGRTSVTAEMVDGNVRIVPEGRVVSRARVVRVTYHADDTGDLRWQRVKGQWKIASLPVITFDNSTPLAAVRTFYLAVSYRRWRMVHRLLPSALSVRLTDTEVAQALDPSLPRTRKFLNELGTSLKEAPIFIKGDTAYYYYGESKVLTLKREEDGWHVESPY